MGVAKPSHPESRQNAGVLKSWIGKEKEKDVARTHFSSIMVDFLMIPFETPLLNMSCQVLAQAFETSLKRLAQELGPQRPTKMKGPMNNISYRVDTVYIQ